LSNYPTLMPIIGGRITSGFGSRRDPITGRTAFHEGVDIPAPSGTPIHAAGGGTVSYSGWRGGYGNVVFIDHGSGLQTRYAHNTRNLVTVGQRVERGDVIAYVGSTGRSLSPHLHYEVLRNGNQINPVPFITETID
ncbi:MAG: M23 family metallopeptidase, partial [Defluviitaleaceae bacterium]|nr:M23 family metallopeptidase [Defluviitaleaceae bacterium]